MIKRPYQNMSFQGQAGRRKPAGEFGARRSFGGDRPSYGDRGDRGTFGGGRGSYGADRRFAEKRMFDAQCNKCGNDCQVPFRPTGQKPVYCSNCFVKPDQSAGRSFGGDTRGANMDMKKINDQLKELNAKLDLLIEAIGINDDEEAEDMDEEDLDEEGESEEDEEVDADEVETLHMDGEPEAKK